jgi:hypothetical protein
MIETVSDVHAPKAAPKRPRYIADDPDWQMLASRN